jgi:HEAT repeat protein
LAKIMLESPSQQERIDASFALTKIVPAARIVVPQLAKALGSDDPRIRMNAAITLMRLRSEAKPAVAALIKAVKQKDNVTNLDYFPFTIQEQAALALGRATAGTDEGVPTLMEALEVIRADKSVKIETINPGEQVSRQASMKASMAGINVKSAKTIIEAKMAFARALGEVGPAARKAVPLLREMVKEDQISDFKISAAEALEKIEGNQTAGK